MKPEDRFLKAVNKLIPDDVYREKMFNPMRGGTPDMYYEATRIKWVEFKYLKQTPIRKFTPDLTKLQSRWLLRNFEKGHEPWVIVGCPGGGFVLTSPVQWDCQVNVSTVELLDKKQIAERIWRCVTTITSSKP